MTDTKPRLELMPNPSFKTLGDDIADAIQKIEECTGKEISHFDGNIYSGHVRITFKEKPLFAEAIAEAIKEAAPTQSEPE